MLQKKPELLAPAGNFEKLKAALLYGADAVYFAGDMFGMRAAAGNFTVAEIFEAVRYTHAHGARAYLTVNTMPRTAEYPALRDYLASLRGSGIDALIVSDLGVLETAKELLPEAELHISTQASSVSAADVRAWRALGASRVVLARELTLSEVAEIVRDVRLLQRALSALQFLHGPGFQPRRLRPALPLELPHARGCRGEAPGRADAALRR